MTKRPIIPLQKGIEMYRITIRPDPVALGVTQEYTMAATEDVKVLYEDGHLYIKDRGTVMAYDNPAFFMVEKIC